MRCYFCLKIERWGSRLWIISVYRLNLSLSNTHKKHAVKRETREWKVSLRRADDFLKRAFSSRKLVPLLCPRPFLPFNYSACLFLRFPSRVLSPGGGRSFAGSLCPEFPNLTHDTINFCSQGFFPVALARAGISRLNGRRVCARMCEPERAQRKKELNKGALAVARSYTRAGVC